MRLALDERGGVDTLNDLLHDVPAHYEEWRSDIDLGRATAAARRIEAVTAKAERLGIEPDISARDWAESMVFLGGYFRRSTTSDELSAAWGIDLPDLGSGDLTTPYGAVSLLGIPREYSGPGSHLWTLCRLSWSAEDRNVTGHSEFAFTQRLSEVIPRWDGLTTAVSVCRLLATAAALDTLSTLAPPEAQHFLHTLALIHTPQTLEAATAVRSDELDAALAWLDGEVALAAQARAGEPAGPRTIELPPPRMIKGHEAAEAYAAEVLAALGFQHLVRTPTGADGGIDVKGVGIVAQVKMEALPTSRDRLQALFGVATVERSAAAFFSLAGYTSQALAWADRAEIALFEFEFDGSLAAANATAEHLIAHGADV
jgi:hypothetical protein